MNRGAERSGGQRRARRGKEGKGRDGDDNTAFREMSFPSRRSSIKRRAASGVTDIDRGWATVPTSAMSDVSRPVSRPPHGHIFLSFFRRGRTVTIFRFSPTPGRCPRSSAPSLGVRPPPPPPRLVAVYTRPGVLAVM